VCESRPPRLTDRVEACQSKNAATGRRQSTHLRKAPPRPISCPRSQWMACVQPERRWPLSYQSNARWCDGWRLDSCSLLDPRRALRRKRRSRFGVSISDERFRAERASLAWSLPPLLQPAHHLPGHEPRQDEPHRNDPFGGPCRLSGGGPPNERQTDQPHTGPLPRSGVPHTASLVWKSALWPSSFGHQHLESRHVCRHGAT
jgi:hypothetical protein